MADNCFSIKKNRIKQGYYTGFDMLEDGTLVTQPEVEKHYLFIKAIDSGVPDSEWGRLCFDTEINQSMVCVIYVAACNETSFYRNGMLVRIEDFMCDRTENVELKKEFLGRLDAEKYVNTKDILLYQLNGRYLYLMLELIGTGQISISKIKIYQQGDNFMNTFPEIYRERNSFFHRYLSVFSSIYNDFQSDIDNVSELLSLDLCPPELLPVYAGWLGIEISEEFINESWIRQMVKEAYELNKIKGTKRALERVSEIILGDKVIVLEKCVINEYTNEVYLENSEKLYGKSKYDVTILIKKQISETLRARLIFMLDQFKPVRCRLHVMNILENGVLDSHSYFDMNVRMLNDAAASLDSRQTLDNAVKLL